MTQQQSTSHQNRGPTLVTFDRKKTDSEWHSLGDQVMGGQSDGNVILSEDGVGHFHGTVRLDNGGGFASVKADLHSPVGASGFTGIELLTRGDGKAYKIGLRNSTNRRSIVYQQSFTPASDHWCRIQLPFSDFVPTWRGRTVSDAEPLNLGHLASVSLFVSGRQAGEFHLHMEDWVLY